MTFLPSHIRPRALTLRLNPFRAPPNFSLHQIQVILFPENGFPVFKASNQSTLFFFFCRQAELFAVAAAVSGKDYWCLSTATTTATTAATMATSQRTGAAATASAAAAAATTAAVAGNTVGLGDGGGGSGGGGNPRFYRRSSHDCHRFDNDNFNNNGNEDEYMIAPPHPPDVPPSFRAVVIAVIAANRLARTAREASAAAAMATTSPLEPTAAAAGIKGGSAGAQVKFTFTCFLGMQSTKHYQRHKWSRGVFFFFLPRLLPRLPCIVSGIGLGRRGERLKGRVVGGAHVGVCGRETGAPNSEVSCAHWMVIYLVNSAFLLPSLPSFCLPPSLLPHPSPSKPRAGCQRPLPVLPSWRARQDLSMPGATELEALPDARALEAVLMRLLVAGDGGGGRGGGRGVGGEEDAGKEGRSER